MTLKLMISAGELSGDEHAGHLVASIRRFYPDLAVKGMGGRNLRKEGVETVVDSEKSASLMGFSEVALAIRDVLADLSRLKKLIDDWRPDILVIVDYPDFNLRLATYAKTRGVKVLYFIPPQVWAWRPSRVKQIDKICDTLAVIFPFEKEFYRSWKISAKVFSVGHPFSDTSETSPSTFRHSHGIGANTPLIAIFPGSRRQEIKKHLTPIAKAFQICSKKHPELEAVIPIAPSLHAMQEEISSLIQQSYKGDRLKLTLENSTSLLKAADCALLKSGTSNLQAAFADVPFSMFYMTSFLSELIVRYFVKVKEFSIVNVIRPGTVNEILQRDVTAEALALELEQLAFNEVRRSEIKAGLSEVRNALCRFDEIEDFIGCNSSFERTAKLVLRLSEKI
jgi:lipid-A-disaccharide synthase